MRAIPRTTLEQWAILAAVVDEGSYAAAAEALHRSQPAISYAIARLQEGVGVPLLAIEGRRAVLTSNGQALLQRARQVLRDHEALEHWARYLKQGWEPELRLVADAAFPRERLLDILAVLKAECPTTRVTFASEILSGAEEAIVDRSADIVITNRVPTGVLGEWLMDIPFIAVARRDHPLHHLGRAPTANDLMQHTQIAIRDSGARNPRDDGWLGASVRWTVSSMDEALAVLAKGLAFGWLPADMVAPMLGDGLLRRIELGGVGMRKVSTYLVVVNQDELGPAGRKAVELFRRSAVSGTTNPAV
jgi:DNA-binding transcriptional LysR family regulator